MKKKWLSRALATMLTGVMAAGMLTGCGGDNKTASQSSEFQAESASKDEAAQSQAESTEVAEGLTYPVDTDLELSLYIDYQGRLSKSSAYEDYSSVPFYAGLSERTGIQIDWQTYAIGADHNAAYNLLLQEEELPNIIFGIHCNDADELYNDGLIYDLTDYLPEYAPDFWEYINLPENAANKRAIANKDGRFLFIPFIRESGFNITFAGPVVRQDWLDELGLKSPVTLEDWEEVLIAFKENYGAVLSFAQKRFNLAGIAGGTGAFAALTLNYYVEDGQVKCANAQEEWKDFLEVMHRWYEEGLIDADFATADDAAVRSRALNGETGVVVTAMSQLTNFIADAEKEGTGAQWKGLSYPRTEEGAPTTYIQTSAQTWPPYDGAMVTTSCSEEIWIENTVAEQYVCPPYSRTENEQTLYNDINTSLKTYVSEMALKFVTGDETLDNFDEFLKQLDVYGLQELLESEQAAYDRYMK